MPPFPFAPLIVFFGEREAGVDIRSMRTLDVVGQINPIPVLFIHGELDGLILPQNSRRLYEAAREPKELYIGKVQGTVDFWRLPQKNTRAAFGLFSAKASKIFNALQPA